jgi:hypothetical protein
MPRVNCAAGNSSRSVQAALRKPQSLYALKCRRNSLVRLLQDCERFFPWPALQQSLRADIEALTFTLKRNSIASPTTEHQAP